MSPDSALSTIAEVAIAVAGFGGVVAAIVSVTPRGLSDTARVYFSGLFTASITIISLSVIPQVLDSAPLEEKTIWRASSGLHALYLVGALAWRSWQLRTADEGIMAIGSVTTLSLVVALIQIFNGVWLHTAWVYLAGLLVHTLVAFSLFPRLLAEMARSGAKT